MKLSKNGFVCGSCLKCLSDFLRIRESLLRRSRHTHSLSLSHIGNTLWKSVVDLKVPVHRENVFILRFFSCLCNWHQVSRYHHVSLNWMKDILASGILYCVLSAKIFGILIFWRTKTFINFSDQKQLTHRNLVPTLDAKAYLIHSILSSLDSTGNASSLCFRDYNNATNHVDISKVLRSV